MSDDADRADSLIDSTIQARVQRASQEARRRQLIPLGTCYYCESPLRNGMLFCDAECRNDWEEEQAAHRRNHGHR